MAFCEISCEEFVVAPIRILARDRMLLTAEGADGKLNSMTVGWGGLGVMWGKPVVFYGVRPERYTHDLTESGISVSLSAFSLSDAGLLSYFGTHSGRNLDKYAAAQLTPIRMPDGGIGFANATLVLTAEKCYSAPICGDGFRNAALDGIWYPKKDYHTLYFSVIRSIYQYIE